MFTLLAAAVRAGGAPVWPASPPRGLGVGPGSGTAPTEASWGRLAQGTAGLGECRGPRKWCRMIRAASGYLVATAGQREGRRLGRKHLALRLSGPGAPQPQKGQPRRWGDVRRSAEEGLKPGPAQVSLGRQRLSSWSLAGGPGGLSEATALPGTRPTFLWSEARGFACSVHSFQSF